MRNVSPLNRTRKISVLQSARNNSVKQTQLLTLTSFSNDYFLFYQPKLNRKLQQYTLNLQISQIQHFIQTQNWRIRTSIPIVRTFYFNFNHQQNNHKCYHIFNQHCPYRLEDFKDIPINQVLYLLKQSIIGFERLYEKYGPFEPTSKMVAINQNFKCKVWINQNFGQVKPQQSEINFNTFLEKIIQMFNKKVLKCKFALQFFKKSSKERNLVKLLRLIDSFVLLNRISVPLKFDIKCCISNQQMNISTQNRNLTPLSHRHSGLLTEKIKSKSPISIKDWAVESTYVKTSRDVSRRGKTKHQLKRSNDYSNNNANTPTKSADCEPNQKYFQANKIRKNNRRGVNDQLNNLTLQSPQDKDQNNYNQPHYQPFDIDPILTKNGWERKFEDILGNCNLKHSIVEGKDVRADLSEIRLLKIGLLAGSIVNSILPQEMNTDKLR